MTDIVDTLTLGDRPRMNTEAVARCQRYLNLILEEYNGQSLAETQEDSAYFGRKLAAVAHCTEEELPQAESDFRHRISIYVLGAWAQKKIVGKITELNAEAQAKRREGLADHLESLGQTEQAEKQRQKAEEFRALGQKAKKKP